MPNVAILQTTADLAASQTAGGIASLVPTGTVFAYAGTSAPTGWLTCDGTAVSRTTYAALYAAIGVAHGYGDNSTTFNLPDYRGRFIRGGDAMFGGTAATRDPDRAGRTAAATGGNTGNAVGSVQTDAIQSHAHPNSAGYKRTGPYQGIVGSAGGDIAVVGSTNGSNVADMGNGDGRMTSETRPLNAYVNYIIKI